MQLPSSATEWECYGSVIDSRTDPENCVTVYSLIIIIDGPVNQFISRFKFRRKLYTNDGMVNQGICHVSGEDENDFFFFSF